MNKLFNKWISNKEAISIIIEELEELKKQNKDLEQIDASLMKSLLESSVSVDLKGFTDNRDEMRRLCRTTLINLPSKKPSFTMCDCRDLLINTLFARRKQSNAFLFFLAKWSPLLILIQLLFLIISKFFGN